MIMDSCFLDDDQSFSINLVQGLKEKGSKADFFDSIEGCLKRIEHNLQDGINTAVFVSGESSVREASLYLKDYKNIPQVKFIIFTSLENIKNINDGHETQFDDFLIKLADLKIFEAKRRFIQNTIENELHLHEIIGDRIAGAMVATLCHEVSNPLTIINGILSKDHSKISKDALEKARGSVDRIKLTLKKIKQLKTNRTIEPYCSKTQYFKV